MKVYIAGKITGDKNYKAKFAEAAEFYRSNGCIVLNPATLPEGREPKDYMRICFAMIDVADVVVFLPDYINSDGAGLEYYYCCYTKKSIHYHGKNK